jgi:uncharacterized membrane protein
MKRQKSYGETLRSVAGFALIGPGLFLLFGHVVGAAGRLSQTIDQSASAGLEVVSSIMLAASWSPNHLAYDLASVLWPALLVVAGVALLQDACSSEVGSKSQDCGDPCIDCA